jgi:phosphatidylglycerol:prolipoprotein diacylglycerol transferase
MLAIGVAFGLWFLFVQGKKQGYDGNKLIDLAFYTILVSLLGAKLVLFVSDISFYIKNPGELLMLARSGGVFQGGLAFGFFFAIWYMRKNKMRIWKTGDLIGPALALGHGFGRIGCFSAGCCYGRACTMPWSVTFTSQYAHELTGIPIQTPLHPVQLYESFLNFTNFFILFLILRKKTFDGQVISFYVINYSIIRYFVEFYRGDHPEKAFFLEGPTPYLSISYPQLFAIIALAAGIILYFILKKRSDIKKKV